MSSKRPLPHQISRPFKLQPRSSKAVKTPSSSPSSSPVTRIASKLSEQPVKKSKPSTGRRLLNFFKKGVPCTSSTAHIEETVDDYLDVIDISPCFNEEEFTASLNTSPEGVLEARTTEGEDTPSPSTSTPSSISIDTLPPCTPKSAFEHFFRKRKGDLLKPSTRHIASSIDPPFATQGDSFYQMPELNDTPSTENIYRLSIYGCPSSSNKSTPSVEPKASEAFLWAYPTNIYDSSITRVAATTPAKFTSPAAPAVEPKPVEVKSSASPAYVIVRVEQRTAPEPSRPVSRCSSRCSFTSQRTASSRYSRISQRSVRTVINRKWEWSPDGPVKNHKHKRFIHYKHLQTLPAMKEEDEGVEDDSSAKDKSSDSDSDSVDGDSIMISITPPISVEDLECEEVEEDQPLAVDTFVPRPRMQRRVAVYGDDQLYARTLSLPIMVTVRRPSPVDWRPTGLRPLLLPIHVALRDEAIHGCRI